MTTSKHFLTKKQSHTKLLIQNSGHVYRANTPRVWTLVIYGQWEAWLSFVLYKELVLLAYEAERKKNLIVVLSLECYGADLTEGFSFNLKKYNVQFNCEDNKLKIMLRQWIMNWKIWVYNQRQKWENCIVCHSMCAKETLQTH